jgi:hypothetical protein
VDILLSLDSVTAPRVGDRERCRMLEGLVVALASVNAAFLRAHPETPWLYESGVFYLEITPDIWTDIPATLARGDGDCPTLCAWRMAELQREGLQVAPLVTIEERIAGGYLFHVRLVVTDPRRVPGVSTEDPSKILGMD